MWINVTKDIFDNSDFKGLNYLYQILSYYPSTCTRPRYNIIIDTEKVKGTENFNKLASIEPNIVSFLEDELSYFVTSSEVSYKITSVKGDLNFNIEEAILFLNQPVSVILENNKNDSEFILAILKNFGKKDGYNKAQEHINNAWLQFENAGGCSNMSNFLEGFFRQYKEIAEKNNRNLSDYFRGIIVLDSDTEFPGQNSKHAELLRKLEILGIDSKQIHILEKRMMENYLPDEVYSNIRAKLHDKKNKELVDWIDAYLNLSEIQKDLINVSKGGLSGNDNPKKQELIDFWNISQINYEKLDNGFKFNGFDNSGNIKNENDFKNAFPNLFKKATHKGLIKRTINQNNQNELKDILDKITKII